MIDSQANEARYRLLAENMTDAVSCFSLDLRRTFASPSYHRLLGYQPEEVLGGSPELLVHIEDWPRVRALFARVLAGEAVESVQYRLMHKDGSLIWAELDARLTADGHGIITTERNVSRRKQAEDLALTDGLTGLANRRCFEEAMDADFRRCARAVTPLSLIMIDVDCFKMFNDSYGHQAGDACLKAVADILRRWARRPDDLAARYGGDELALILPDTNNDDAAALAGHIDHAVKALTIPHMGNPGGIVTASFGVATTDPADGREPPFELVERADQRLYDAKTNGRGRVMVDIR